MLTSALCGASGTLGFLPIDGMNQLIMFRSLQGIGGGMTMGLAFTIIGDVFSPAERGKYQAFFAAVYVASGGSETLYRLGGSSSDDPLCRSSAAGDVSREAGGVRAD